MASKDTEVIIAGAGPGGLVLALSLHQIGISCRVFEAVTEIKPIGAGINLLPHAVRELDELGLIPALDQVAIRTQGTAYFNRFGQLIYKEPAGMAAGYPWPQFSIHRGDMQAMCYAAVKERLGDDAVVTGHRLTRVEQHDDLVTAYFVGPGGEQLPPIRGSVIVGCEGIHSALRKQFYPQEGDPIYAGITSWRGTTPFQPLLDGAHTIFAGWISVGKLTVYPMRNAIDAAGNQLTNWVASVFRDQPPIVDWTRRAQVEDFIEPFSSWHFDWLEVPELLRKTETVLVFPVIDRDPAPTWTFDRATLLGDAAHPMYPRGSNGAGQAVIDARCLAGYIKRRGVTPEALQAYDRERVAVTTKIVLTNRSTPPDVMLREVEMRSGGKPFRHISDVISETELRDIMERYKAVAGFQIEELKKRPAFV